jgi:multicomponent Na+:H+ antiporter subunit E
MTPLTRLTQFAALFAFWLLLSDQYAPVFLVMGLVTAALVTACTHDLFMEAVGGRAPHGRNLLARSWHLLVYLAWIIWRILVASVQVAYFVAHPSMPLQPRVLRFRTTMRRPLAQVTLANSITLVPGTLTLNLDDGTYLVHALVPAAADDLVNAKMQNIVARLFGEDPESPPDVTWLATDEVAL